VLCVNWQVSINNDYRVNLKQFIVQMALKRPNAISFSKKNEVHPFDSTSTSVSSLEFWASKNDASLFVVGQTTKKRPNGLAFVRMYDGQVLDMIEVGIESWTSMNDFKVQFFSFLRHFLT